jgi:hypothetical protein
MQHYAVGDPTWTGPGYSLKSFVIYLKGDLPVIWGVIRNTWRDRKRTVIVATLCAGITPLAGISQSQSNVAPVQEVATQTPLEDRVNPAPEDLLKRFSDQLNVKLSAHIVTPAEQAIVTNALAQLTPLQREVLQKRLRAVYFIDGMPNNALTFADGGSTAEQTFSIAVRAGALHETVSELVTRKERTLFNNSDSEWSVAVDAGSLNAMVYVLLHEATHIVDYSMGATPDNGPPRRNYPLVSGIWRDRITPADMYKLPILMSISYRRDGRAMPISDAPNLYNALEHTPFISVYASSNWHDDLAELVAWTELTGRLHQPYRILISKGTNVIRVIEPAQSSLVQARSKYLNQLTGS